MYKKTTQIKFTIDTDTVSVFKSKCEKEGVSMTSVIREFMKASKPTKGVETRTDARPLRKKSVKEIISLLNDLMYMEEEYRDAIPEQFTHRYEAADHACEHLSEAIMLLEEAYQ